jgi:hypothetical protein
MSSGQARSSEGYGSEGVNSASFTQAILEPLNIRVVT